MAPVERLPRRLQRPSFNLKFGEPQFDSPPFSFPRGVGNHF
jgi:hypothetical protein